MKRILLAITLFFAIASRVYSQEPRGFHEGETFELDWQLPNNDDHTYTASNHIRLVPGFKSKPEEKRSTLLDLGLDEYGIYPPDSGLVNNSGKVVGTLGGVVDIGAMGGLSYTIPIDLPVGINGMQPSVAIGYNNQGGNGLLGWGWDLYAGSRITRTGQTIYHDGQMTAADLTKDDRFVLDGQRLVVVSGDYGMPNSEYKTENDCMSKIVLHRVIIVENGENYTRTYFKVWDKFGNIMEYQDMLRSPDGSKEIMWMLSSVTDRYGNAMKYHYVIDNETGETRLDNIEYTFNESQNVDAQFQVKFFYSSNRTDYEMYYIGGCQLLHRDLLESIKVIQKGSDKPLYLYHFNYTKQLSGQENRLYCILSSIDTKSYGEDGSYESFNPTVINWDETPPMYTELSQVTNSTILKNFPFTGDFDGDGYTDLAIVPYKESGHDHYTNPIDIKIYLNDRNCGFTPAPNLDITSVDTTLDWVYILDMDGDGLDDIVPFFYDSIPHRDGDSTVIRFYKNNGISFGMIGEYHVNNKASVIIGDFDGNSTSDVILLENHDFRVHIDNNVYGDQMITYVQNIHWMGFQSSQFQTRQLNGTPLKKRLGPVYEAVSLDYDGDGTNEALLVGLDIAGIDNYGSKLVRFDFGNNDDGLSVIETYTSGEYPYHQLRTQWCHTFPGDYNGDGKSDILYYNGSWHFGISDGTTLGPFRSLSVETNLGLPSLGYFRNIFYPSLKLMDDVPSENKLMVAVADFDGDGCSDVCYSREGYNNRLVVASRITLPVSRLIEFRRKKSLDISFNFRSQFTHVGNFLGRDNASFLESIQTQEEERSGNAYVISPASVNVFNSVASVTDGMGNTTRFTYDYLMPKDENGDDSFYSFSYQAPDQYGIQPVPLPVVALRTCEEVGINGSSVINKYSHASAYFHKYGHGFMGFGRTTTETYRNSLESAWKTRKVCKYGYGTMGPYAMMLPQNESVYSNENGLAKLISQNTYGFTLVKCQITGHPQLVVCPAMTWKLEDTYSMDDEHQHIKTSLTEYEYTFTNGFYQNAYYCSRSHQSITSLDGVSSVCELETTKQSDQSTFANTWIVNRPNWETVTLTRNGETKSTRTAYSYDDNSIYDANAVTFIPNDGSQPTDPLTVATHYGYDAFGNNTDLIIEAPYGIQNELQREVHYKYGQGYHHRLVTEETKGVENSGYSTTFQYDFHDRLKSATDCNGMATVYESSPCGVEQKAFPADGTEQRSVTLWADDSPYKPEGAAYYTWNKKTGGVTAMTFYHKSGLELRSVTYGFDGTPIFSDKRYNVDGLLEKESDPYMQGEPEENLKWTTYTYDDKDRLLSEAYPDGTVKSMEYHGLQTITTTTPLAGDEQKTVSILNGMGWPKENVDAYGTQNPTSVYYEYYPDGNLKWTRIGNDETTTVRLGYDHAGNRTTLHDPDYCSPTSDLTSVYNAFGEEVSTTTPRGLTTTYVYDRYGRMTQRSEEEPAQNGGTETKTTVWTYNEDPLTHHKGLLHSITYPGQAIVFSYDGYQRLQGATTTFSQNESYTTSYTYDPASRMESVQYPSGFTASYRYNNIGYLKSVTDNAGNELYRTQKANPMGQIERFGLGDRLVCNKYYHPDKQTVTNILTTKGENILQNLSYEYDGFSNLASRTDNKRNLEESFTYDHLNRLTGIWLNNSRTGWMDYDPYGRMTRKTIDNARVFSDAVYDETTKPHAMDRADINPNGFTEHSVTYTCFDKVKTVTEGNNTLEYSYGYDRQRVFMEEHANGVERTKRYVGNCEFVTITEGNVTTEKTLTYLTGPTGVFAVMEKQGDDESLHFILKDNLGSWTTITDKDGVVEQELSFDAWGSRRNPETWNGSSQLPAPIFDRGFTGHEHLYAFGLINMNGRMYDPQTSSFLSVDAYVQSPDNSQSFNRYAYCMNNPLKYVDPSGWYMTGAMHGSRTSGLGWGDMRYLEPIHTRSDFSNAYHLFNQALYGDDLTDTGSGYGAAFQAGVELYQGTSPGAVWSFSHLINNYVNNPSALNRRDLMNAGITDYTYKTWWSAEGLGGYQYTISFNQGSFSYGNDNYNFGYKGYLDATIWAMDLSVKGAKSTDLNKAILLAQTLGVPMGSISEGFEMAAKAYHNVPLLKAKSGLSKPQYVSALTKEGNAILKFHKIAGKACFALSAGIEFVQMIDYHNNGGQDNNVYFKGGLDVVMGLVGLSGPIGFGISMVYFVADFATDGFYGWGKIKY